MSELIARLRMGGARRVVSITMMVFLGLLILWLSFGATMGAGWRVFLFAFGGLCLFGAWSVRAATAHDLLLTREGLSDESGRVLAPLDNIESLNRGIFAAKPTGGFVLRLKEPMPFAWAPGAWWRVGRRLGVGGSLKGLEVKAMAEMIELVLADRAGLLPRD